MDSIKITGWCLLFAGLLVIGLSVNQSYRYFSANAAFPVIFEMPKTPPEAVVLSGDNAAALDAQAIEKQMQDAMWQAVSESINGMIPNGAFSKILNAALWSVFATFLVYAGASVSGVGVKMLKSEKA
jgi:hypothetical protein